MITLPYYRLFCSSEYTSYLSLLVLSVCVYFLTNRRDTIWREPDVPGYLQSRVVKQGALWVSVIVHLPSGGHGSLPTETFSSSQTPRPWVRAIVGCRRRAHTHACTQTHTICNKDYPQTTTTTHQQNTSPSYTLFPTSGISSRIRITVK